MMVKELLFKQCQALKLENDLLRIIILPAIGGKVASIYRKDKDFELLFQNKEKYYKKPKLYAPFAEYDAAGFDDAFPTIDSCKVIYGHKTVLYPDHGEIWSGEFQYKVENEQVSLAYHSKILEYEYKKEFYLVGDSLICQYDILNRGHEAFPCIWAYHCLIRCEADMQLLFPKATKEVVNVQNSDILGKAGTVHSFPVTHSMSGEIYSLHTILPASAKQTQKYYVNGKVAEGRCGVYYPSKDVHYNVYFDKEKLPYLGFWITEGGFRGDFNCALEPTNGYYDNIDIAAKNAMLYFLQPGRCLQFKIRIELL